MSIAALPSTDDPCCDEAGDAVGDWLQETLTGLGGLVGGGGSVSDAARIDRISLLEQLKSAVAAAQASEMVHFARSQVAEQRSVGVDYRRLGRGIADQIALACRVTPSEGSRQLGRARAWIIDLPETLLALTRGDLHEWAAQLIVQETSQLDSATRRTVDAQLHAEDLSGLAPREIGMRARRLAYRADPAAAVARGRKARSDRRVTVRPAPDTMALLSGLLPVEQGVACLAALKRHTDTVIAAGDPRTRGQVMADTLVERLTGQAAAAEVPVEIQIHIPVDALHSDALDPHDPSTGDLPGFGPVPAAFIRDLVDHHVEQHTDRRSYRFGRLGGGQLSRRFARRVAALIKARDRWCRDPYCTAPIRHLDHIRRWSDGGTSTAANGRGVCERGNYVREMPGWTIEVVDEWPHTTITTTPTGHRYRSQAPQPP